MFVSTGRLRLRLWRSQSWSGGKMKSNRTNNPLFMLAAAVVTAAPFVGLAWRTREWLGW
jgi:hypothetical protein